VLEALTASGIAPSIKALIAYDERVVLKASLVARALSLPGHRYETAYAARNKFIMRTRFAGCGLPCPRFGIAQTVEDATRLAWDIIGFPLVVKPLFGLSSQGVVRANTLEELQAVVPVVQSIAEQHALFVGEDPFQGSVLLEEYLAGREVAVDGIFCQNEIQCAPFAV
jgi:biotin carboxylase